MTAAAPFPDEFPDEPFADAAETEPLLDVRGLEDAFRHPAGCGEGGR